MATEPRIVYEFGPFRMDPDKQTLLRGNDPVPVTPKAFETLLVLVRRSREVVSKEELLKEVWPNSFVEESNLSQNIFLLRKALGDTAENRQYIVTLPGRGYRFAASVRTVTEQSEALVAQARTRTQIVIEENEAETDQALKALPIPQKPKASRKFLLSAGGCGCAAGARRIPSHSQSPACKPGREGLHPGGRFREYDRRSCF